MINYIDRELKTKLCLPFTVYAEDRTKAFTKDMELATIFYLAESKRKKSESHILKQKDETLVFIAEVCYPIWQVPWGGATLLFDGLDLTSHTFSYNRLPEVNAFNKDIQRSAKTIKLYSAALSRNANYFENFVGTEKKIIGGLIVDPYFVQDFSLYSSKVKKTKKPSTPRVILSPILNKIDVSTSIKDLSNLRLKIIGDIKNLNTSMKLLSITTRKNVKIIRKEIQKIREKYEKRIENTKPRVTKKVKQIQEKHDKKINKISKRFERQLRSLHKNHLKIKKSQKHIKLKIKRYRTKIKSCKNRKNKQKEILLTQNLEKIRKEKETFKKQIKEIQKSIEKLENTKNFEISEKRIECETQIEESTKILRELEASREARIKIKQPEIISMEEKASLIINQINEMVKSKKSALNDLDCIYITRRKRIRELTYLPFFLIRYEMGLKKRYDLYPPSIVSGMGILAKLKGVLGTTKMKCLLQPHSKAITVFLNQLLMLIQKDPMFEKEVTEAGIHNSVLRTKNLRLSVKRGLKELNAEKWVSKNELQTLNKLLFAHTPTNLLHKRIKMKNLAHV